MARRRSSDGPPAWVEMPAGLRFRVAGDDLVSAEAVAWCRETGLTPLDMIRRDRVLRLADAGRPLSAGDRAVLADVVGELDERRRRGELLPATPDRRGR